MDHIIEIKVEPKYIDDTSYIKEKILKKSKLKSTDLTYWKILRKSIDARKRPIVFVLKIVVGKKNVQNAHLQQAYLPLQNVAKSPKVHIIGAGPAGYFAALQLIEQGMRPIIYERGKNVRERRKDLRAIQQFHQVNPQSNYCFGEGGAGTFSDGKLYTRANKRGNVQKVLNILVKHGASEDILVDAHPHIGSNKLPRIVQEIRATIIAHGGQVHFNHQLTDIIVRKNKLHRIILNGEIEVDCRNVILATGHSARDIYELLQNRKIQLTPKDFAVGVRIEHPQELIDQIQYGQCPRDEHLPAASYALRTQVDKKGVFSFCMCPGGQIVPAMTAPGEIVVNGMSLSRRNSPYANAGIVVTVDKHDFAPFEEYGVLAGMKYQQALEQHIFNQGKGDVKAPAQRLTDFIENRLSSSLNNTSYIPGLYPADLNSLFPKAIIKALKKALPVFGRKMHGFYTNEANVIATESRTSAPVRIPRNPESLMHTQVEGLYPCGEGAGYAGGIMSAALDGQNVAIKIMESVHTS